VIKVSVFVRQKAVRRRDDPVARRLCGRTRRTCWKAEPCWPKPARKPFRKTRTFLVLRNPQRVGIHLRKKTEKLRPLDRGHRAKLHRMYGDRRNPQGNAFIDRLIPRLAPATIAPRKKQFYCDLFESQRCQVVIDSGPDCHDWHPGAARPDFVCGALMQ